MVVTEIKTFKDSGKLISSASSHTSFAIIGLVSCSCLRVGKGEMTLQTLFLFTNEEGNMQLGCLHS